MFSHFIGEYKYLKAWKWTQIFEKFENILIFGSKFGFSGPLMIEIIPHNIISNWIFPLKCGFGIGYDIGRNFRPESICQFGFQFRYWTKNKFVVSFVHYQEIINGASCLFDTWCHAVFFPMCFNKSNHWKKPGGSFADWILVNKLEKM